MKARERRKRRVFIAGALFIVLAAAALGFVFGLRQGAALGLMADAAPRGALALHSIQALKVGKNERVLTLFESDIDLGLLTYYRLEQFPYRTLIDLVVEDKFEEYGDNYIRRLATYRKKQPSFMTADMFDVVPKGKEQYAEEYHELATETRESIRIIELMVERYAP